MVEDLATAAANRQRCKDCVGAEGYDEASRTGLGVLPQIDTDELPDGFHWIGDVFDNGDLLVV